MICSDLRSSAVICGVQGDPSSCPNARPRISLNDMCVDTRRRGCGAASSVPGKQDGVVMVKAEVMIDGVGHLVVVVAERTLPATETRQRLVRVVRDLQP